MSIDLKDFHHHIVQVLNLAHSIALLTLFCVDQGMICIISFFFGVQTTWHTSQRDSPLQIGGRFVLVQCAKWILIKILIHLFQRRVHNSNTLYVSLRSLLHANIFLKLWFYILKSYRNLWYVLTFMHLDSRVSLLKDKS